MKRFFLAIITVLLLIPIMSYAAAPKNAGAIDSEGMVLIPRVGSIWAIMRGK